MRKGTHSCLECRRRKVRCVSGPHARKCNGCSVRELECTDQELCRSRSPNSGERKSTRDRVQELEGRLDQVLRNQSRINGDSYFHEPERNRIEPSGRRHVTERRDSATDIGNHMSRKRRKVDVLASNDLDAHVPKARDAGDGPFLELFEDLENDKRRDRNPLGNIRASQTDLPTTDESGHRILQAFRLQIPNSRELMSILQAGRSTMVLWSEAFPDALGGSEDVSPEQLRDHIYRCLYSDNIADAARLMLCLALHIQQLPSDLETMHINLPAPSENLQVYYMSSAESLLASDERLGGTLSGLECMILQSEFYINVGNLRKVWLIIRRAVNLAQLLGLHRKIDADIEPKLAMRRNAIWTELWQRERGFSLLLGLPHSTLDSQLPPLPPDSDVSDLPKMERFSQDLGIVMGHIIDRDQDHSNKTYSITLKIEEQLEECQSIMSTQWWDFTPGPATPTDAIRSMFVAKLRFYTVRRLLHLPFLLKASDDRKYESSRLSTLESSREIIKVYNVLRDEKRPVLKLCDMVDFQVFAAAMTLVVDLLICSQTSKSCDQDQKERDWQLVLQTAVELRRLSQSMRGCNVAALGARVLEDFSNLRNGSAEGVSKVDIPYFGRIEIRRSDTRHHEHASYTQPSSETNYGTQSQRDSGKAFEGSMESMVSLDSYFFPLPVASQPWQVSDESWTHMLDSGMADDWSWCPSGEFL